MRSATRGDYLFVGPIKNQPLGLYDLKKGTILIEFKRPVADVYDETMVTEQVRGSLPCMPWTRSHNQRTHRPWLNSRKGVWGRCERPRYPPTSTGWQSHTARAARFGT